MAIGPELDAASVEASGLSARKLRRRFSDQVTDFVLSSRSSSRPRQGWPGGAAQLPGAGRWLEIFFFFERKHSDCLRLR